MIHLSLFHMMRWRGVEWSSNLIELAMIHLPTWKCSRGSNDTVKLYTDTQAMYERGEYECLVRKENDTLLPLHFLQSCVHTKYLRCNKFTKWNLSHSIFLSLSLYLSVYLSIHASIYLPVTWNVWSWSGGHEFEPRLGQTWDAWCFCPNYI